MIHRTPKFVELERTFKVLVDRGVTEDSLRFDPNSATGKSLSWIELLTIPRVVILSEAGSGKTEEIRQAARRLRSEGRPAFFLRLENMSSNPEDAFDEGTLEEFQEWRRTGECAWLFLDSVDEARLHSPKDFEKAIRAVKRQLGDAGPRTHIILTSRASEWRPVSDLHLCETHIPFHQPQIQAASDSQDPNVSTAPECDVNFQFVTLEDLSRAQVMTFAKACALEDLDGFLRALDHVGGATHHSRPADLLELFELWRSQRRFGSRHELIQASIKGRLREHDLDREQVRLLDRDRAHQAAKTLAAATTLSRCQEILVPDSVRHRNGIAIEDVLPDWNGPDRTTLLSRPLFDEETYGTVRFHHRSAREYLAAEWFADLLNKGSSRRGVNALFFREQYGHPIVAPVLRPILPWLVHLDGRICRAVQEHVPEILLEGGDPASLPVETRRVALERICERIADGDCEKWPGTLDHVAGFAREDLTESVRSALARHSGCGPVLEFLLQLVWKGRLVGTWEDVAKILRSDLYRGEIGRWGWIAASAIGSKAQLQELREWYLETADEVDREILSTLIEGLPSDEDESRWLQSALARSAEKKPHSYDSLEHELTEFVERLDAVHLPALLVVFDGLMRSESGASVQEELSHRHLWLLPHACQAMVRLIQDRHAAALDVAALSVLHLYGIARKFGSAPKELKYDLRSLISEWPELSLAHFWNSVDLMRVAKQPLEPQIDWHQALFHSLFRLFPFSCGSIADRICLIHHFGKLMVRTFSLRYSSSLIP